MPSHEQHDSSLPAMVRLSARVATAYVAARRDVPIEDVPSLIEGVYRSLKRIAAVEETGTSAVVRFLESPQGRAAMGRPALRVVQGGRVEE